MFTFRMNCTCIERINEKGCLSGLVCVSKAHTKERILVIFNINIIARQQALLLPYSIRPYSRLWRRQGQSRGGPYACFLAAAATTKFQTNKRFSGGRNEGSTTVLE